MDFNFGGGTKNNAFKNQQSEELRDSDMQWGQYFAEQNAKQKETLKGKVK